MDLAKAIKRATTIPSEYRGWGRKKKKKSAPLKGSWEAIQAMPQAEKDRIRIAKKKKASKSRKNRPEMYPPPKTKASLKRKPMTVEQKNKVLKKMGLKPLKKKNKGKNG